MLLGIGIDDTFVICAAWEACEEADPQQRMVKAMEEAGPSIAVTSLTDVAAFAIGTATVLPALRDFCIYACLGIAFDFAFQPPTPIPIPHSSLPTGTR
eukprot:gene38030-47385_t